MAWVLSIFSSQRKGDIMNCPTREDYNKARDHRDYQQIADFVRECLSLEQIIDWGVIDIALRLASKKNNFILVDALLRRLDILESLLGKIIASIYVSVDVLRYLEINGVSIDKVINNYGSDILFCWIVVSDLTEYDCNRQKMDEACQNLCDLFDFCVSRGVNTADAYEELLEAAEPGSWVHIHEDYYDRLLQHLEPPRKQKKERRRTSD